MMILRLIVLSLLFCISHVFAAVGLREIQTLDPKTQSSLELYMSFKTKQGHDYIGNMLTVAKESPSLCLRYLAAKTLSDTTGYDADSIKAKSLGNEQLKAIFISLEYDPGRLGKECAELRSALAGDIIKNENDPYCEFATKEINPLLQRDQHIYVKLKIAEYSSNPLRLVEILQEPYIKDDIREQVLSLLKARYNSSPDVIGRALLEVLKTANTLTLKESCLKELLSTSSNRQWVQFGLQAVSQIIKTKDIYFCPLLEKIEIPIQWLDLCALRIQILNECKLLNNFITP